MKPFIIILAILAIAHTLIGFAIWSDQYNYEPFLNRSKLFKACVCGPVAIISYLIQALVEWEEK